VIREQPVFCIPDDLYWVHLIFPACTQAVQIFQSLSSSQLLSFRLLFHSPLDSPSHSFSSRDQISSCLWQTVFISVWLKRIKPNIALHRNPSQSYRVSLAIWDHTVTASLPPDTSERARPTPANQAGTRFTYPGGMEGWVDLGSLIAAWPGIEPTTAWSKVQCPNSYTTKPPMVTKLRNISTQFITVMLMSNLSDFHRNAKIAYMKFTV